MRQTKAVTDDKIRGDQLRELIFLVYLRNKYEKGENKIKDLQEIVGYNSPGGIYGVLNSSGYFRKTLDGIELTEKGEKYLNKQILTPFGIANYVGILMMIMGTVFLIQWIAWSYYQFSVIVPLQGALLAIGGGIVIRFFMLRINYWFIKKTGKVDI